MKNFKHILIMAIAVPSLLALSINSNAARIYNETSVAVTVVGSAIPFDSSDIHVIGDAANKLSFNTKVALNPGERSENIDWKASMGAIILDKNDKVMCSVSYAFGYAELQGRHYLLVSQDKEKFSCFLCGSEGAKYTGNGGIMNDDNGADLEFVAHYKTCS
jgi:hypothetical protein